MKNRSKIILAVVLLCACGRVRFARPGASYQEFINDYNRCEFLMGQPTVAGDPLATLVIGQTRINHCMEASGYAVGRGNGGFRP